ncbi:MAG: 50S ribosomal protein L10 [Thermodesulfobacteriota bacterium]|nr:50S ribosomal protein L10 [Thermodesulfobacteriota bacterium]
MNRNEKNQVVSVFSKRVAGFQAAVLTHYRGLNVEQVNILRRRLREEKISYHVVKNTLMNLAAKGTDLEKLADYFEGPTAIAISHGDPALLAKILLEFVKTQPKLEIKVGLIQGKVTSPDEIKILATLPPRKVLLAQILGGIQISGQQLGGTILSALRQVIGVVQARVDQLAELESGK